MYVLISIFPHFYLRTCNLKIKLSQIIYWYEPTPLATDIGGMMMRRTCIRHAPPALQQIFFSLTQPNERTFQPNERTKKYVEYAGLEALLLPLRK